MNRTGMTLMELAVGLVVLGVAVTAGYGAVRFVTNRRAHAVLTMELVQQDMAVRSLLIQWLRSARVEGGTPFIGMDRTVAGLDDDELSFTAGDSGLPLGGGASIRLYIDRDPDTPDRGLVFERARTGGLPVETVELVPTAASLQLRYLYVFGERRWVDGWVSSSVLPAGVELTLAGPRPDSIPPLLLRPIRVALSENR